MPVEIKLSRFEALVLIDQLEEGIVALNDIGNVHALLDHQRDTLDSMYIIKNRLEEAITA